MSFLAAIPAALGTTWGGLGTAALGVAGAGVSAVGAVGGGQAQAQAQKQMGEYNVQMSRYNMEVARQGAEASRRNAELIRQAGEAEAAKHRQKASDLLATQRATYGAAGVEFEGSPLLVMQETAARAEQDALAIRYNYQVKAAQEEMQAWKLGSQVGLLEGQAGLQKYYGDLGGTAETAGWLGGAASLLKGGFELFRSPLTTKAPGK